MSTGTVSDPEAVRDFCDHWLAPAIHLTVIGDDRSPKSAWFGSDSARASAWAAERNAAGENVYFSPNVVEAHLPNKARKADVREARFVHVDIDPPKGGAPLDKAAVIDRLNGSDDAPSIILDSGNGIQALWRLETPSKRLEEVEQANRALVAEFGGDAGCWNIDRVLRMPGTINWPNEKKRSAGRTPVLARLVAADAGAQIEVEQLAKMTARGAQPVPLRAGAAHPAITGGALPEGVALLSADDLLLGNLDPLRHAIEHPLGTDRSRDGMSCARQMRDRGLSDEQIVGILANPANAVHAHYAAQSDPVRNVLRTLAALDKPLPGADVSRGVITATQFCPRDPATIPPRPWIMEGWLLRNTLTAVVAPGGIGKSTFSIALAVSLASGRDLFGKRVIGGPRKVWYWNLEDDGDEIERQVHAALRLHGLAPFDIAGRLFTDSGPDGASLCLAREQRQGAELNEQAFSELEDEVRRRGMDVAMIDPWVSAHQVDENSNTKIDPVVKRLGRVAKATSSAWMLVHHTSKPKQGSNVVTTDSARGASALTNAARSTLTLNRMTPDQAQPYGISSIDARRYVRISDDKHNRTAAADGTWIEIESVDLPNGDSVGAARRWHPPKVAADTSPEVIRKVQAQIAGGNYRADQQAKEWGGVVVAEIMGLPASDRKGWQRQINRRIQAWIEKGYLAIEWRETGDRKKKRFLAVGPVCGPACKRDPVSGVIGV